MLMDHEWTDVPNCENSYWQQKAYYKRLHQYPAFFWEICSLQTNEYTRPLSGLHLVEYWERNQGGGRNPNLSTGLRYAENVSFNIFICWSYRDALSDVRKKTRSKMESSIGYSPRRIKKAIPFSRLQNRHLTSRRCNFPPRRMDFFSYEYQYSS